MSDSESSEEDNLKKLREAVDPELIDDSFYQSTKKETAEEKPKSLRNPFSDDDNDCNFMKLSPGVQKYVAKQLENHLEQLLSKQFTYTSENTKKHKRKRSKVKLLSDSVHYIDPNHVEKEIIVKKLPVKSEFDSDDEEKIKSVLITAEDILSQNEVSNWAKSTRIKNIFRYKQIKIKSSSKRLQFKQKGKIKLEEINNFK